ncbi:hypothetical protein Y024_5285 [Burkholderia pseudomallei TSV44]|nr:hypothetical protein Y024_5285 [Burkholderia pseudomallei TSV44]
MAQSLLCHSEFNDIERIESFERKCTLFVVLDEKRQQFQTFSVGRSRRRIERDQTLSLLECLSVLVSGPENFVLHF